jgi:hypothetical protein
LRKSVVLEEGEEASMTQISKVPTVIAVVVVSILFYAGMAEGFGAVGEHTDLGPR